MRYKKIMILTIILTCLLAVSAVSANEINSTDVGGEIVVDDTIGISEEINLTATHAVSGNTFDDIQESIGGAYEGDTISLSGYYKGSGSNIQIYKTITIEGNGAILDADGKSNIFEIRCGHVSINNVTFINGKSKSSGAIDWKSGSYSGPEDSYGVLTNCNFINNTNTDYSEYGGGALYLFDNHITVKNCYFEKNSASIGGAIYITGSNCIIEDCDFKLNHAYNGGAIYNNGSGNLIKGSNFLTNYITRKWIQSDIYGLNGTDCSFLYDPDMFYTNVYVDGSSTSMIEDGSKENPYKTIWDAYRSSGEATIINIAPGIYKGGSNLFFGIYESKLTFKAMGDNVIFDGEGGFHTKNQYGMDSIPPMFTIQYNGIVFDGITFKNAYCDGDGSVLQIIGNDCTISNCKFINCSNSAKGGAIYVYNNEWGSDSFGCDAKIYNCEFTDNHASNGGAIYWDGNKGYLSNCTFNGNYAYRGGAVFISSSQDTVTNCIFKNNSASYASAIYCGNEGVYAVVHNSTFINNTADVQAGAIFWRGDYGFIIDSTFVNNAAGYYEGAVQLAGDVFNMDNCVFSQNTAGNGAGALGISGTANLNNTTFTNNVAGEGGAILVEEENVTIINCQFINNCADEGCGGAIKWKENNGNLSYSTFKSNTATGKGGAIYWNGDNGVITYCDSYTKDDSRGNDIYICGNNVILTEYPIKINVNDVSKYYGGFEKLIAEVTKDDAALSNVDVKININGKIFNVKTNANGQAIADLNLTVGNYSVVSEYEGVSIASNVNVKSTVSVDDEIGMYLNSKVTATFLNVDGKDLRNVNVNFKAGDKAFSATTNANGIATANIDLGAGSYTVTAINPVNNEQKQFKLVINKANSAVGLAATQNNGVTTLTATLAPASATGNVIFNVNGVDKSATIKNGKATLTLSDLNPGDYSVTASYNGDKNLNASKSNTVTFKVDDVYLVLTAKAVTKTYGTSTKLIVNLQDSKGNAIANVYVKIVLGSTTKNIKTNDNGQATMDITNAPGTYTATITYADAQKTAKITVKKATSKLTAKAKTFKKSVKTKKYTVTLKTNQNKVMKNTKLTLKVNGKTYSATTNAKGQATFKITKLTKKGKFTGTIAYKGNAYYNKLSKKVQISIK